MFLLQLTLHLDNAIAGLDFNPNGELVATIDSYGVCMISDVNTDNCNFHLVMGDGYSGKSIS